MDLQELEKELAIIEEKKKQINKNFEDVLGHTLKNIIDENVLGIRWKQYIPSFNDGEPCLFTLSDLEFYLHKDFAKQYGFLSWTSEDEQHVLDEEMQKYVAGFKWYEQPYKDELLEALPSSFQKIIKLFSTIEPSYFENCFGYNIKISFIKNEFIIDDWDCGY